MTADSYMKALAASTRALGIGVIEYKLAFDLIVNKVHFCADHKKESLLIDNDAHTLLLHDLIELSYLFLLHVIHDIAIAVAPATPHVYFHPEDAV